METFVFLFQNKVNRTHLTTTVLGLLSFAAVFRVVTQRSPSVDAGFDHLGFINGGYVRHLAVNPT